MKLINIIIDSILYMKRPILYVNSNNLLSNYSTRLLYLPIITVINRKLCYLKKILYLFEKMSKKTLNFQKLKYFLKCKENPSELRKWRRKLLI